MQQELLFIESLDKGNKMSKEQVKYYPLIVHAQSSGYVTRERNQDDEWDNDDTAIDTTILGVETSKESQEKAGYNETIVPFEVVDGKDYYLVYVTYSTGDSFHREDGVVRYIDLYETREKAEKTAKVIQDHYNLSDNERRWNAKPVKPPKSYNEFSLKYRNEVGEEVDLHVSWTGYFERLSGITVQKVQLHEGNRRHGKINYRY